MKKISLKKLISELGSVPFTKPNLDKKPHFRVRIPSDSAVSTPPKSINRKAGGSRSGASNSVWDIVDFLKDNPGSTENEINIGAFGFDRNHKNRFGFGDSNKKYADLLRRAVAKGLVVAAKNKANGRVVYSLPGQGAQRV